MAEESKAGDATIVQKMAKDFYGAWIKSGKVVVKWDHLPPEDQQRFVDGILAAIEGVRDTCDRSSDCGTKTINLSQGRQAILDDHAERRR